MDLNLSVFDCFAVAGPGAGQAAPGMDSPMNAVAQLGPILPMIIIFGIFYFLLIRPQQRKQNELKKRIEAIRKGDRVITSGGLYATVVSVKDNNVVVAEIADKVRVDLARGYIASVLEDKNG